MSKQPTHQEELFEETEPQGPVECLGMTFENDEARRAYFLDKLSEKLKDPEFRKIEGFPIGEDEDILWLSDPPYYTACPNPFLEDFIKCYGKPYDPNVTYSREPFAVDVSEGKTDPIYTAHAYHTKVPHKAIMRAILHYTEPGDIVLDGFAGSGMTGVAAQMCGSPNKAFKEEVEQEWRAAGMEPPKWGTRRAVLNDLGPAATFIASNYNLPFDVDAFEREARRILNELDQEIGWMYETLHLDGKRKGRINYTVWSDVFACPDCGGEIIFLDSALDRKTNRVREKFPCPHCGVELTKIHMERLYETHFDPILLKSAKRNKRQPVLINYKIGKNKFEKRLDSDDLSLLNKIESMPLLSEVPTKEIPFMHMTHQRAHMDAFGISHAYHFYLPRAAHALALLWEKAIGLGDTRLRNILLFLVEQAVWGMSVLNRYSPSHFSQTNRQLTGVYYVASQHAEVTPWYNLSGKLKRLIAAFRNNYSVHEFSILSTGTAAALNLPNNSLDYIFTDPPFGENIYYADLNFLIESWHHVWTNAQLEAIVDRAKKKNLPEYQYLMQRCLEEYYRVLKPGRWMTVVFHNSRNSVWNAIQEAMLSAGFVVADVRTLDKQQGSYRQVTSSAVKQDLVISAYKPNSGLEERFKLEAGTEEGAWDFVKTHLRQLPVFVLSKDGQAEAIAERQNYLLFDRMVAFHVQRGVAVPFSAAEFYAGLKQYFSEREGMYFLPEQAAEYDKKRLTVKELLQLELAPSDESSAIQWLRQQLTRKPQTFQELHPQFMKVIAGWGRHEKPLELSDLLKENFLCCDSSEPIPAQVVSWMKHSAELRELIRTELAAGHATEDNGALHTRHPVLLTRAQARWYVPDPNKAQDLEKLRERHLLKEFEEYSEVKQKKLKIFRLEAVRAGFKKAWQERDYQTIIGVANKISEQVLQEDPKLLMWYDQALTRTDKTV